MASPNRPSGLLTAVPAVLLALSAACGDVEPTNSLQAQPGLSVRRAEPEPMLAACLTEESAAASAVIGVEGGLLSAGSATIFIPPRAVRTPTRFTIEPLAGPTLRVRITARGRRSFGFARPVGVMIGYAHCPRQEFLGGTVSVWHVDDATNAPLERMPAVNDRQHAIVGFLTTHLSTYAVAN
ncbi:MAG TPA: hypothetical protein VJ650_05355 [Gemmatimonadaceae bacterium]|nr:hypothetical protein [Gemmatimonadaceae bacterium]